MNTSWRRNQHFGSWTNAMRDEQGGPTSEVQNSRKDAKDSIVDLRLRHLAAVVGVKHLRTADRLSCCDDSRDFTSRSYPGMQ